MIDLKNISIDRQITGHLKTGILQFQDIDCHPVHKELWTSVNQLCRSYRDRFQSPSEALELLRPARDLFRAVGIEPTRIRPSSEALLRRAIKGKPLYQINSIVDACNLASLTFLLPIGLYDREKIRGDVIFRLGQEKEQYDGIGKDPVHVHKRLTLADESGAFGNPSSDSLRTSIELKSSSVLMVIFAPAYYNSDQLNKHMILTRDIMLRYHPAGKCEYLSIFV